MSIDLDLARRVARAGTGGAALASAHGASPAEARSLAHVGHRLASIDGYALTPPELLVMQLIAAETRAGLAEGRVKSPESRRVSRRARKSSGWCAATVGKRIFVSRHNRFTDSEERGLGFVELAGNGYVWLTPIGWALIHAMETGG